MIKRLCSFGILLACAVLQTACSGSSAQTDELAGITDADRKAIWIARSEQLQVTHRIEATASRDENGQLCHEMCADADRSCVLAEELCSYGPKYPHVLGLHTKCRASRDLCRVHGTQVPRSCICDR